MVLSKTQAEAINSILTGKYNEIVLAGGTGSGKSIVILHFLDYLCETIPGCRIGVYRLSQKNIKNNLIPSIKKLWEMKGKSIEIIDMKARYENGSELIFGWADITKDPDADNVKGAEFTAIFFNEANQIDKKYIDTARTRIGRWNKFNINGQDVNIKPMLFLDFNPTDNWVKANYYDRYINGTLPENIYFQLSLPKDNPFLSKEYFKMLETLPENEYKRYVLGDWSYSDNPNQLILYDWLRDNTTQPQAIADKMGVDIAYTGNDTSVISYVHENKLTGLEVMNIDITNTTLQALHIKNKAINYKVQAKNVNIDATGIGAGVYDALQLQDFKVNAFIAAGKPIENYSVINVEGVETRLKSTLQFANKRSEAYWNLRELLRNGNIKVIHDAELWEELTNTNYLEKNGKIYIEPKDQIKQKIGRSPDKADAVAIAFARVERQKIYGIY